MNEIERFEAGELGGPIFLFAARPFGSGGQGCNEPRVQAGGELGKVVETYAVAGEVPVEVGTVFAPSYVALGQEGANFIATQLDEGANDACERDRQDAAESPGTRAACEAVQDGFSLIVERVTGGDCVAGPGRDLGGKKFVAGAAGFLLDITGQRRGVQYLNRKFETRREIADELFILVGFRAAQAVVDVEDSGGKSQIAKGVQEEDGISAAGNGYTDPDAASCH
ncbi:MAG TPA: hypothetical protein VG297_07515 [Bryobacteraceae bacterium]|nr:hypothetical protein [Bryobacteraceae bacterium]